MSQSTTLTRCVFPGFVVVTGLWLTACGEDGNDPSALEESDAILDNETDEFAEVDEHEGHEGHEANGLPEPELLPFLPSLDEHTLTAFANGELDDNDFAGFDDSADFADEDSDVDSDVDDAPQMELLAAPPANCDRVKVVRTGGATLRVRPDPSTRRAPLGALNAGEVARVLAVENGENVNGVTRWYKVDGGDVRGFVSGAFTSCIDDAAPAPVARTFKLPLRCNKRVRVTQGNNSAFSHNHRSRYAFDFGLARGTPLVAVADGRVVARRGSTRKGDACWSGGGPSCANKANYVVLQHADGKQSVYVHLDKPTVAMGARVRQGQQVGLSGGTGYSTGPHAHVARQQNCGYTFCQTVETRFADVAVHNGIPRAGETVTSRNCP